MSAAARRRALSEQLRSLPQRLDALDAVPGKIMGAYEQRIIVQRLCTGRFIVGVVQTDQGISQERPELTARFLNLRMRSVRRLEQFGQVGAHLHVGVVVVVDSRSPFRSLAVGEDG